MGQCHHDLPDSRWVRYLLIDVNRSTLKVGCSEYVIDTEGNPVRLKEDKRKSKAKMKNGKLFDVPWRRIVLDEAHQVRNRKC